MSADHGPVMARDVQIQTLYQACCYRRDCTLGKDGGRWVSEPTDRRSAAADARRLHLDAHRAELEGRKDAMLLPLIPGPVTYNLGGA